MALFKIARGPSNALGTLPTKATEGFAYFQPYDGSFYIDITTANAAVIARSTEENASANRIKIAAGIADKVGHTLSINGKSFNGIQNVDVGTIGTGYGGTGKTEWTQYGVIYASATDTLGQATAAAGGAILVTGNSKAPTWLAAGNAGDILKSNSTTGAPEWIDPTTSLTAYKTVKTLYFYAADASGADAPTGTNSISFNGSADKSISTKTINALNKAGGTMTGTVYFANGTVYYIDNAGCAKFNSLDTVGATNLGSTLGVIGATTLSSTLAVTGATTLNSTLAVKSTATMYHVIPADDNTTYELGSATARWKKLHIGTADTYGGATQPIWWSDGKPAECTSYANAVVKSAGEFTSEQSITLTDDVTGTASSKAGWSIAATAWKLTPHEHDATYVAATTAPTDYNGKLIFTGMKTNTTLGITSELTYSYVIGLRGYSSKSGGGSHEFAFNDSAIYHRMSSTGADTWSSWNMLVRSAAGSVAGSATQPVWVNSAGIITACTSYANASVNYANSAGAVAWGNVTGKPSTFAPSSHTHNYIVSRGNVTCETGGTKPAQSGLSMQNVYNNGYPTTYGNIMTMYGSGAGQLLLGWSGSSSTTAGVRANAYIRSQRDTANTLWSDWYTLLDSGNYNDYAPTKTGGGASGSWGISITGNAATATNLSAISFTGGDGNTGGRRLMYQWSIGAWSNYRMTFLVTSRHTGSGLVAISVGCNSSTVSLANCYAEIKYFGPTGSGSIIQAASYEIYINSAGTAAYLFWLYTDYNSTSIIPISGGNPSNGTWTTNPASYGTLKAQTEINPSSVCYGNAATATKATQDGSGNTITSKYVTIDTAQTITGTKSWGASGAGGQLNGAATNGGINSIRIGDDTWLGDCNVGGIVGMKAAASSTTTCGFYFYNGAGTQIGQLYANGTGLYINKTLQLHPNTGSYTEGIRIYPYGSWATIMLLGNDITATSGTSTNSWGIFNNNGTLYINKATSNGAGNPRVYANANGWYFTKAYGAVWNDYAEYRQANTTEPGRAIIPSKDGIAHLSTERLQSGGRIISDTYGFAVGESDKAKTPVGLSGRVLAYPYQNIENYKIGDAVCTAPNGTVDIMSREEIKEYPERIIGIVNEIPNYEIWEESLNCPGGEPTTTKIIVNGRIWIDVR